MKVILDELSTKEFFSNGGVARVVLKSDELKKMSGDRAKYLFYEYKSYIRFMRNLYLKYMTKYPDLKTENVYREVNEFVELECNIGTKEYTIDPKFDNVSSLEFCNFYYCGDNDIFDISNRMNKKDPYGIPNVCFSSIESDDPSWNKYEEQRINNGFDDSEVWNLDYAICGFIIPRLKRLREIHYSCPQNMSNDEWDNTLDSMILAFELLKKDEITEDEELKISVGLNKFCSYFRKLWD